MSLPDHNSNEESNESKVNDKKPHLSAGTHEWTSAPEQFYKGSLLYNNLHGSGIYFINKDEKVFYDGYFYANNMEGYCQIFYHSNGSNFQGLFKDNRRFGPGVLTYVDGSQDVGLWDGFSLIRVGRMQAVSLPSLTSTSEGHIKTLKYRNLVDVCLPEVPDIAEELLKSLGANEKVLARANELYSQNVKNESSLFFNKKEYDKYYPEMVPIIDILIEDPVNLGIQKKTIRNKDDQTIQEDLESETESEEPEHNVFSEKLTMIRNQLQEVEKTLHTNRTEINLVSKQIDYCNRCCADAKQNIIKPSKVKLEETDIVSLFSEMMKRESVVVGGAADVLSQYSITYADISFSLQQNSSATPLVTPRETPRNSTTRMSELADIESYLEENNVCTCFDEMEIVDLAALEDRLLKLVKEDIFYDTIRRHLKKQIDKLSESVNSKKNILTKKMIVNQILAWNNEPLVIQMLKHSFLHRNTEDIMNFQIPAVVSGHRLGFTNPGLQESKCYAFLQECHDGQPLEVIRYLRQDKINVNVTDGKGNSGIFYASINTKIDLIRILIEFGANPNQINDEGLTPLSLSVLNYLARKHKFENWESAFLPDTIVSLEDQKELKSWHPSKSFLNLAVGRNSLQSIGKRTKQSRSSLKNPSHCIFSTKFSNVQQRLLTKDSSMQSCEEYQFVGVSMNLFLVENCIKSLLDFGALPNYGESPLPTFLMSIYTENHHVVKMFVEHGANTNIVTPDENLNALHILASGKCLEENLAIAKILLANNCDVNCRTNMNHWPEQKEKLVAYADNDTIEDLGKNPLHILCMRRDFDSDYCNYFEKLVEFLIEKIDIRATYLGLDALRLAILSGNVRLIVHLLNLGLFDPYWCIPNEGTTLTMFFAERFKDFLPLEAMKKVLQVLVDNNINPLSSFEKYGNVLDCINELAPVDDKGKGKVTKKTLENKCFIELEGFMRTLMTHNIFKNIEMCVTKLLYDFAENEQLENELLKPLAAYITPKKFIENLKVFFNNDRIQRGRFDKKVILNVLEFLLTTELSTKAEKQTKLSHNSLIESYEKQIEEMDFSKIPSVQKNILLEPVGLDDQDKYLVCFECMKKIEKNIYSCPKCEFIHFCEKKCFQASLKRKTNKHPCEVKMFTGQETEERAGLIEEWDRVRTSCTIRYAQKQQELLALKEQLRKEAKKKHMYGTRSKLITKDLKSEVCTTKTTTVLPKNNGMPSSHMLEVSQKLRHYSSLLERRESPTSSKLADSRSNKTKIKDAPRTKCDTKKPCCHFKSAKQTGGGISTLHIPDILSKCHSIITSRFEPLPDLKEPYIIKKTRKVPAKPHFFMEILSKLFPHIDLTDLLLPYTCYSDGGHLYYAFNNTNLFCRNYSIM